MYFDNIILVDLCLFYIFFFLFCNDIVTVILNMYILLLSCETVNIDVLFFFYY